MNGFIKLSKAYHTIIILTFFLPFIANNCGPSAEEMEAQRIADSTRLADSLYNVQVQNGIIEYNDTVTLNKPILDSIIHSKDTTKRYVESAGEEFVKKYISPLVAITLVDNHFNITGFGSVVLRFDKYLKEYGITNSYLLILLSFCMILRKKWRFLNTILIIDILGFIFLFFAEADMWGYWVCLYGWIGMILIDILLYLKNKKNNCHQQTVIRHRGLSES